MYPQQNIFFSQTPIKQPNFQQPRSILWSNSPPKPKILSQSYAPKPIFSPPSQIPAISFNCPIHPQEKARRICSVMHCNKRVLLCEECMLEDPEHVKNHKNSIIFIRDFLNKIEETNKKRPGFDLGASNLNKLMRHNEENINENARDLVINSEKFMSNLKNQILIEKSKIHEDFNHILRKLTENLDQAKNRLLQDLDDYYISIQEYFEELKKKFLSSSHMGYYIPENIDLQNLTQIKLAQKLNELKEEKLIEAYLRKIRDFIFSSQEVEIIMPKEDNISFEMQNLMADKLRKIFNNPPLYKESLQGQKIFSACLNKIPTYTTELYEQLKEAITFIFIDESQKLFFDPVTKDHKSAQLPIMSHLNLVHNSYIRTNHTKQINCIAVLSGDRLATGSSDSQIMIWDLTTGEHISTFQGHKGPVISLCQMTVSDKQNIEGLQSEIYLASGSGDKNIILWNLNDENDTIALRGHDDSITCLMDALDGRNLFSGSADRKIIVWDVLKGKTMTILPCNGSIYYLHFMKDASKFLSCDYSGALNIWKIEYMRSEGSNTLSKILLEKVILTKSRVVSLNSSYANPSLIIGGCEDKVFRIWNLENGYDDEKIVEKNQWGISGDMADFILVEAVHSQKNYEKFGLVYICKGEDAINIIQDNGERRKLHLNNFTFYNTFGFHKLQIFQTNDQGFKIVVVNQNEGDKSIAILRLEEGKGFKN